MGSGLRKVAREHLERIIRDLDKPEVGRDVSAQEWRQILGVVSIAVQCRIDCLDEEQRESGSRREVGGT